MAWIALPDELPDDDWRSRPGSGKSWLHRRTGLPPGSHRKLALAVILALASAGAGWAVGLSDVGIATLVGAVFVSALAVWYETVSAARHELLDQGLTVLKSDFDDVREMLERASTLHAFANLSTRDSSDEALAREHPSWLELCVPRFARFPLQRRALIKFSRAARICLPEERAAGDHGAVEKARRDVSAALKELEIHMDTFLKRGYQEKRRLP